MMADERTSMAEDDPNAGGDTLAPEILEEAEGSGWVPKEQFRGAPERWVDAKTWVEKGRELSPLIKAQNAGLKSDLERERQERLRLEAEVKAQRATLATMEEAQLEATKLDIKEARADIKKRIAEASRAGEHELVADLTEQLVDLREPEAPIKKPNGDARGGNGQVQVDPVLQQAWNDWSAKNTWYGTDFRKTGLAEGIGRELAAKGLRGVAFYQALDKELGKEFRGASRGNGVDRVEGSRGSGDSRSGGDGKKGYHDLPREAQVECDKFANRAVGPRKKFQKVDEYRAVYAAKYFEQE